MRKQERICNLSRAEQAQTKRDATAKTLNAKKDIASASSKEELALINADALNARMTFIVTLSLIII